MRAVRLLSLVLLLLVLLRVWWGWYAHRKLQRIIDEAHQHHEPASAEDLAAQVPTSPTGASAVYASAMLNFRPSTGRWATPKSYVALPAPDDVNGNILAGDVAKNAVLLARLRAARSLPTGSWGAQPVHPVRLGLYSRVFGLFQLSDLLAWEFCLDHVQGNDAQALETFEDWLKFSQVIDVRAGMAGLRWSSLSVQRDALRALREVAPELQISATPDNRRSQASRQQVRALIEKLLDDREIREGGARPWQFRRVIALDEAAADRVDVLAGNALLGRLLQPAFDLRAVREAHRAESYIFASAQPNWPAANSKFLDAHEAFEPFLQSAAHALVEPMDFDPTSVEEQFHILAQRRVTAAMLALRLYAGDHDGQYPASLNQLVPDYLPAVPIDPMAADGRPLAFQEPQGPRGAVFLYSVGKNGADDGGPAAGIPVPDVNEGLWMQADAIFAMKSYRLRDSALPSTRQAQKHD